MNPLVGKFATRAFNTLRQSASPYIMAAIAAVSGTACTTEADHTASGHPTVITALNKPGFAQLLIIAKNGDTTDLTAKNLEVGHIVPGVLDMQGTRDTDLKIHPVKSVSVDRKGSSGAESDFILTMTDDSTLHHRPAPAVSDMDDGKYQFKLPKLDKISPNLGMALEKAGIQHSLPCVDIPALKQGGVYVCPSPAPKP